MLLFSWGDLFLHQEEFRIHITPNYSKVFLTSIHLEIAVRETGNPKIEDILVVWEVCMYGQEGAFTFI